MRDRCHLQIRWTNHRWAATLVILAIGFLLLAPDPHDHGDAGSIGGLLRLLLPDSHHVEDPHQPRDESQSAANGSCPIHFWHQVAATGLLVVLLLRFALSSILHVPKFVNACTIIDFDPSHSRAPPVFLS